MNTEIICLPAHYIPDVVKKILDSREQPSILILDRHNFAEKIVNGKTEFNKEEYPDNLISAVKDNINKVSTMLIVDFFDIYDPLRENGIKVRKFL